MVLDPLRELMTQDPMVAIVLLQELVLNQNFRHKLKWSYQRSRSQAGGETVLYKNQLILQCYEVTGKKTQLSNHFG